MDATTAQAIHDLVTNGRLSEASTKAVSDALGLDYDESSGRWISDGEEPDGKGNVRAVPDHEPQDKAKDSSKADAPKGTAAKGAAR